MEDLLVVRNAYQIHFCMPCVSLYSTHCPYSQISRHADLTYSGLPVLIQRLLWLILHSEQSIQEACLVCLGRGLSGLEPPGPGLELDIHAASRPEIQALAQNP